MKIETFVHCGNAPKMQHIIDLVAAIAKRDESAVQKLVRDDFSWRVVGSDEEMTYNELGEALSKRPEVHVARFDTAMSHGNIAMCEGVLTFADKDELHFCTVGRFTSTAKDAVIRECHTYFIPKSKTS